MFSHSPFDKPPFYHKKSPDGETLVCVEKTIFSERLKKLENGFYIKFFAFKTTGLVMSGHSMLIKKIDDNNYSFFDPNHGEYLNLNLDQLVSKINASAEEHSANRMVCLDAMGFVKSYQIDEKKINDSELSPIR